MCELGVQSIIRRKRRFFKGAPSRKFDNIVNRQSKERKINEVFVTDITYLPYQNGYLYLLAVQDLYNNEIVSWRISNRNDLQLVLDTVEDLTQKRSVYRSTLHSDQGFQYTSHAYHQQLHHLGLIGSHSRRKIVMIMPALNRFSPI